jgi:UDP-N-acetylmuramoylalanine--D-glutamate ligase
MNVSGKKIVVLGLGESGMEIAKLLREKGADVLVRDNGESAALQQRAETLRARGISVETGSQVRATAQFDLGVLSPGIDPKVPLVQTLRQARLPLLGELEMAYRFCECPIVAITGTNGKTTTTELVAAVLRAGGKETMASGNIGTAFSAAVRRSAELDVMVLEVSSFQLEHIADFRPRVSVYLNLTPDHLDRYADMEEYRAAKWEIFKNQTEEDWAIVNADAELPAGMKARKITFNAFGKKADYQLIDGDLTVRGEVVCALSETGLVGPHNAENLLAALAVGDLYNIPRERMVEALKAYTPQPHRCERVAEIGGVLYLNDSKATNIDALEKALLAMRRPVVLIAGGKDKGLDFGGLRALLREKVKAAVLIGQMAPQLEELWKSAVPCHRAESLPGAVDRAEQLALEGDVVLLSPGCSSFDMFRNYEERGEIFRQAVLSKAKTP